MFCLFLHHNLGHCSVVQEINSELKFLSKGVLRFSLVDMWVADGEMCAAYGWCWYKSLVANTRPSYQHVAPHREFWYVQVK